MSSKIAVFDAKLTEERDYWIKTLSRRTAPSGIPLDSYRPATYSARRSVIETRLTDSSFQSLSKLTGNSTFLVYTALMTAVKICLFKYTGNETIVVGSPARRKENSTAETTSALAIVDDVGGRMSARQLLSNVRETLIQAYSKQSYPYDRLVRNLDLEAIDNRCALFDVAVAYSGLHKDMPDLKNDVTITFFDAPGGLAAALNYNSDLFQQQTLERFIDHVNRLLFAALQNVEAVIGELDILTEAERDQLVNQWSHTGSEPAAAQAIHELFEAQAARSPDAVALVCNARHLSYAELNRRANQLGRYLGKRGVAAEVPVGICLERSIEMVVALLGVLKAGGAYVPLDPSYPEDRLQYILNDCGATLLIATRRLAKMFSRFGGELVRLGLEKEAIEKQPCGNLSGKTAADHLAYVIYTSGSTGQPKGVMIEHRGVCNLAVAQSRAFEVTPASRILQFASLSFDASVSEMFMALSVGATLSLGALNDMEKLPGDSSLIDLLRGESITTVTLPPALMAVLSPDDLPALEAVIAAGEKCPGKVAEKWSPGRRFYNAYGPTEVTVCASLLRCDGSHKKDPPIGRPLLNTQIYLLAADLKPVAAGLLGELHVGGTGLARGYHNRPDLTAEKLIPNPLGGAPGTRLYKSGDLARYLPDKNIEFIGRMDQQVKVRGYRVELGEIEAALTSHEGIRQAAVVLVETTPGESAMVAHVVSNDKHTPSVMEMRAYLGEKLPDYMIPSVFNLMESLPLTPNGKIDLRALPAPAMTRPTLETTFVAPRTPTENTLAEIWRELLGLSQVGIYDHFFDLGGHSLVVTRMVSRIRELFSVEVPLAGLFNRELTITRLAEMVDERLLSEAAPAKLAADLDYLDGLSDEEVKALIAASVQPAQTAESD